MNFSGSALWKINRLGYYVRGTVMGKGKGSIHRFVYRSETGGNLTKLPTSLKRWAERRPVLALPRVWIVKPVY